MLYTFIPRFDISLLCKYCNPSDIWINISQVISYIVVILYLEYKYTIILLLRTKLFFINSITLSALVHNIITSQDMHNFLHIKFNDIKEDYYD